MCDTEPCASNESTAFTILFRPGFNLRFCDVTALLEFVLSLCVVIMCVLGQRRAWLHAMGNTCENGNRLHGRWYNPLNYILFMMMSFYQMQHIRTVSFWFSSTTKTINKKNTFAELGCPPKAQ